MQRSTNKCNEDASTSAESTTATPKSTSTTPDFKIHSKCNEEASTSNANNTKSGSFKSTGFLENSTSVYGKAKEINLCIDCKGMHKQGECKNRAIKIKPVPVQSMRNYEQSINWKYNNRKLTISELKTKFEIKECDIRVERLTKSERIELMRGEKSKRYELIPIAQ